MSQVLSTIGGALSGPTAQSIAKIAQPITGILGTVGNIVNANRAGGISSTAANQQKDLANLSANPAALAARIRALQQPLSSGLTSDVTNETQAALAERGLSSSPQIAQQILAQALAPYLLQEQNLAQNALFSSFNPSLTNAAAGAVPGQVDTSNFWKQFFPQNNPYQTIGVPGGYGNTSYPGSITDSGGGPPSVDSGALGPGNGPPDFPGSDTTPPDFNPFGGYGTGF